MVWVVALIVLIVVLYFIVTQLKLGGNNPISAIFGLGKDHLNSAPSG